MYRRLTEEEYNSLPKDILRFSVSRLIRCPYFSYLKSIGKGIYTSESKDAFVKGSTIHYLMENLLIDSREVLETEKKLRIISEDKTHIISGILDQLCWSPNHSLYIRDYKSCNYKSFYHFYLKNGVSKSDQLQVSLYAYLLFINENLDIKHGAICKVDKDNILNQFQRSFDLISRKEIESFLALHPTILYQTKKITEDQFIEECGKYIIQEDNSWNCNYCYHKETGCPIYEEILKEYLEKKEKEKKEKNG